MLYAVKNLFKKIYSIELSEKYHSLARTSFYKYDKIKLFKGDSGQLLPYILRDVKEPSLFWIDAHYQGSDSAKGALETPIIKEIESIMNHNIKKHVILIDDARLFVGKNDYPTIEALKNYIFQLNPGYSFEVKDDIIRLT